MLLLRYLRCLMSLPGMTGTTPPPVTEAPDVPCPGNLGDEGWLLYNDYCYRVFSETVENTRSFHNARQFCVEKGGDLMSILDEAENVFMLSMVSYVHIEQQSLKLYVLVEIANAIP